MQQLQREGFVHHRVVPEILLMPHMSWSLAWISPLTDEATRFLPCSATALCYYFCLLHSITAPHPLWQSLAWNTGSCVTNAMSLTAKTQLCVWCCSRWQGAIWNYLLKEFFIRYANIWFHVNCETLGYEKKTWGFNLDGLKANSLFTGFAECELLLWTSSRFSHVKGAFSRHPSPKKK